MLWLTELFDSLSDAKLAYEEYLSADFDEDDDYIIDLKNTIETCKRTYNKIIINKKQLLIDLETKYNLNLIYNVNIDDIIDNIISQSSIAQMPINIDTNIFDPSSNMHIYTTLLALICLIMMYQKICLKDKCKMVCVKDI